MTVTVINDDWPTGASTHRLPPDQVYDVLDLFDTVYDIVDERLGRHRGGLVTTVETVHIDCPECAEDIAVPVRLGPVYADLAPGVVYVSVGSDPVTHTCGAGGVGR